MAKFTPEEARKVLRMSSKGTSGSLLLHIHHEKAYDPLHGVEIADAFLAHAGLNLRLILAEEALATTLEFKFGKASFDCTVRYNRQALEQLAGTTWEKEQSKMHASERSDEQQMAI